MAEKDIVQNLITQLGQSQDGRAAAALAADYALVDERDRESLLALTRALAAKVNFYNTSPVTPAGDWTLFFKDDATDKPHRALLEALFRLYQEPRSVLNAFPGRHLDFYYQRVLGLGKKAAVPDRAHLLLELKKQAAPVSIGPAHEFSAGKDATKVELVYVPTRDTVINRATVDSIRSLYVDRRTDRVLYAPVANSSDGLGGALSGLEPKWRGFGHDGLPAAQVGFALASPVLRLAEGVRKVTVTLAVDHPASAGLKPGSLGGAFDVFLTGPKGWEPVSSFSFTLGADKTLTLTFERAKTDPAIVDYDAKIHGGAFAAAAPIVQVLLKADSGSPGYSVLKTITVLRAKVAVTVSEIASLDLQGDSGAFDPKKAFAPFGPEPAEGARFRVGYAEAFAKRLSRLALRVTWKAPPEKFATLYANYGPSVTNTSFTARVAVGAAGHWSPASVALFNANDAQNEIEFSVTTGAGNTAAAMTPHSFVKALDATGVSWTKRASRSLVLARPVLHSAKLSAQPKPAADYLTFELSGKYADFLRATYRTQQIARVLQYAREGSGTPTLLEPPYTPVIQSLALTYDAATEDVVIAPTTPASAGAANFASADVQFFHSAYFGQMREHGYQRQQFSFLSDPSVSLLPRYDNAGELLIGFANLAPGDSVSVLFQLAEGSADPDLPREHIRWSVLCDNYWRPLADDERVVDTTNEMLASGLVQFVIPTAATTDNTILPADRIWLRAAVAGDVDAVCQFIAIAANAIEVRFSDRGNDPAHLQAALAAGSITKLRTGVAAVKKVSQPYASFGGAPEELDASFRTRVAERLRHKNRCITPWDYERIVLEAFPNIHKVKCVPHARPGAWLAPGHVMLVVIPDLRNRNAVDPLAPKCDADTLSRVEAWVRARAWGQSTRDDASRVHVKNPNYERIQLAFKVRFRAGYEFNYHRQLLSAKLVEFLSPWAFPPWKDISFGGRIYKSALLDFVEEVDFVDFVTDFRMYQLSASGESGADLDAARPRTPDAILVSATAHQIEEVTDA